ncbi:hypothetical protein NX059_009245 [Plenodomus lindquistii]|nr:hypothetical protein NX059_009245 [Plenodomus lindquistii]
MDSQGASFAFDPSMDFGAAFAAPQQFTKPIEDETSVFFGDEGIDATTFIDPTVFATTQDQILLPQNLNMDNTSMSASIWDTQLTPQLQHTMSAFPPTPVQSFDSMYQPGLSNSTGKRSLDMGQFDFPPAKRHESLSMGDFPLFPSMSSTATATSNWGLDTQLTPPVSTAEFGLSDDAADVCATWFQKFNVLPSDRHIESLSQLTGESADAIRSWFGRLLKQGMGSAQGDSAYKSQTSLIQPQHEPFWNGSYSTDTLQASPSQIPISQAETSTTPEANTTTTTTTTTTVQPATALRGSKKRCTPTEDPQLLGRDPSKIYQCTRKCGKRYGRKCDWKRNEEEGYPCKSWLCSLCISEGVNVKPCFRKYHFAQHFRNIHPDMNPDDHEETSIVSSETEFPRNCGFCRHRFVSRQDRIDHIADHFKAGKSMLDWREETDDDSHDSDNSDDNDNDNGSGGDGFDGASAFPPPPFDPSGEPGSKHNGGGNGGSGSDGSEGPHSQGGYFQFQLSQLQRNSSDTASTPIIPTIGQCISQRDNFDVDRDQLNTSLEPAEEEALQCKQSTTPENGQNALAGDVLAQSLSDECRAEQMLWTEPANGLTEHHLRRTSQANEDLILTAQLSQPTYTGHDSSAPGLTEATVMLPPTVAASLSAIGFQRSPSPKALPSSSSAPLSSSALLHHIPQGVPPGSQSFLSVRLLGAGGFSTVDEVVHRGTNLRLGRKTLKNRDASAIEELKKEINVLQKLRHPHVIRFLDAYSSGDKMSILLSPVAETTLALWLERTLLQRPTNVTETIVGMFGCLASSVRYLHEQRPVVKHMDIKPQNILIVNGDSELPQVVLCDFGISSSEDPSDDCVMPITRQYTAPEVFETATRKEAADIWSLGCVFAEMASVSFSQGNTGWLDFRKAFSGRTGKYYWQDVPDVQARLSIFVNKAKSATEESVARTLKSMLNAEPSERPDATSLTMIFTPAPCCVSWTNNEAEYPGPREELDWLKDLDHEKCADHSSEDHVCTMVAEATSEKVSAAEEWLNDCLNSHEACQQVSLSDTKTLPTRLLELTSNGNSESSVCLIDSIDIGQSTDSVDYMALSHVWSHSQPLLLSSTMTDIRRGLPVNRLPEDLNMAIATTQRLGYRYIWTDALCIIQDSTTDKEQECKAMANVFRNAALTIVLDQLATPNVGAELLDAGTTNVSKDWTAPDATDHSKPASTNPPSIDFSTPGFAWSTRAWVLQERLLSHRFLHVGKQLYWECNALKASETLPRGLAPLVWEKVHSRHTASVPVPRIEHRVDANTRFSPDAFLLRNRQVVSRGCDAVGDGMQAVRDTVRAGYTRRPRASAKTRDSYAVAYKSSRDLSCGMPSCGTAFTGKFHKPNLSRHTAKHPHTDHEHSTIHRRTHLSCSISAAGAAHLRSDHTSHANRGQDTPISTLHCTYSTTAIAPLKAGRREIAVGGQLDQHGPVGLASTTPTSSFQDGMDQEENVEREYMKLCRGDASAKGLE